MTLSSLRTLTITQKYISMAERYEIVFVFSPFAGPTIELRNFPKAGGVGTDDDYEDTNNSMRFIVTNPPTSGPLLLLPDLSTVPSTLRTVPFPPHSTPAIVNHSFLFHRQTPSGKSTGWVSPNPKTASLQTCRTTRSRSGNS
ncbi:hypothetical protein B0H63DRAFT_462779 [Podospora didyma]|uniref:Uncharacterized protein n=1 Tax=Podospora didyma TaxID=330526 RepID=A0AAE0U8Y3_9PEZI|nr:hypothetical protein B0H63DRAFT_462779 [Podospora didyma]